MAFKISSAAVVLPIVVHFLCWYACSDVGKWVFQIERGAGKKLLKGELEPRKWMGAMELHDKGLRFEVGFSDMSGWGLERGAFVAGGVQGWLVADLVWCLGLALSEREKLDSNFFTPLSDRWS